MENMLNFSVLNDKYKTELENTNNSITKKQEELSIIRAEKYVFEYLPRANKFFQDQYDTACKKEIELTESICELKEHKTDIERIISVIEYNIKTQ